jgi:hypothetical protein
MRPRSPRRHWHRGTCPRRRTDGPTIVIGAQDFGESAILAQVYGQALAAAGYPVSQQALGGFRDLVFTSFDSGDINFTAEYAASALEFLNGFAGEASGDIDDTAEKLQPSSPPAVCRHSTLAGRRLQLVRGHPGDRRASSGSRPSATSPRTSDSVGRPTAPTTRRASRAS